MLGFFPFQVRRGEYVAAVYVMTRNLAQPYRAARFRLTIGGLTRSKVRASATDPLTGASVPVKLRRRGAGCVVVELPVTDSPRMLRLVEGGGER